VGARAAGEPTTVVDVLRDAAARDGDIEAYVEVAVGTSSGLVRSGHDGRRRLTFAQWDRLADRVAALLAAEGVGRGDVVALLLPSSIDYALCYQAAARLGAVTTGINLRLGRTERDSAIARVLPAVTVVDKERVEAGGLAASAGRVLFRDALGTGPDAHAPQVRLDPADAVAVVWTSGSTGVPKGAVFDHRCLRAVAAGTDVLSRPGDRRLSPLPFAHVGYMTRAWDEIGHRVTTVVTPDPWSAAATVELMETERVTVGQGVPTQWALVLEHPDLAGADLSALRVAGTGAARVPAELVRAMRQALGCPVVVRYTSTESALGTGTAPDDPDEVTSTTVGRPVPGVELSLVSEDGVPVAAGKVGRVRLRSASAMRGYVGQRGQGPLVDAEATASVLDAEGWVTTGDLGRLDDGGNLQLVGRAGEMYIRGGYNVYPAEVEAVLGSDPAVRAVAVVGVPDPVLGEIGVAFVVAGAEVPALARLRGTVAEHLADYKAPDRLVVLDALPLTPMGKVDKVALARRAPDSTAPPPPTKVGG
jgi:acyl-CoA synthetase (AMP-forming)/AMP-acid ligase II